MSVEMSVTLPNSDTPKREKTLVPIYPQARRRGPLGAAGNPGKSSVQLFLDSRLGL